MARNKQRISKATGDQDYDSFVVEQKNKLDDIQRLEVITMVIKVVIIEVVTKTTKEVTSM